MEVRWTSDVMRELSGTLPARELPREEREEKVDASRDGRGGSPPGPTSDEDEVARMVEDVQEMARVFQRELEFRVEDDLDRTVVQVKDRQNDEVIRQIPSEQMLELARNMERIRGLLFNEST